MKKKNRLVAINSSVSRWERETIVVMDHTDLNSDWVEDALDFWNKVGIGPHFILQVADLSSDPDIKKGRVALFQRPIDQGSEVGWSLCYGYKGEDIIRAAKLCIEYSMRKQEAVFDIITHELGHILGLPHNKDPNSVMKGNGPSGGLLLPSDIARLKKKY